MRKLLHLVLPLCMVAGSAAFLGGCGDGPPKDNSNFKEPPPPPPPGAPPGKSRG